MVRRKLADTTISGSWCCTDGCSTVQLVSMSAQRGATLTDKRENEVAICRLPVVLRIWLAKVKRLSQTWSWHGTSGSWDSFFPNSDMYWCAMGVARKSLRPPCISLPWGHFQASELHSLHWCSVDTRHCTTPSAFLATSCRARLPQTQTASHEDMGLCTMRQRRPQSRPLRRSSACRLARRLSMCEA